MQPTKADYTPIVETYYRLNEFARETERRRIIREVAEKQPRPYPLLRSLIQIITLVRHYRAPHTHGQVELRGKRVRHLI